MKNPSEFYRIHATIPLPQRAQVLRLAWHLTMQRGKHVSVSAVVAEALEAMAQKEGVA